ncbi:hypothetical protein AALP_AA7G009100 [Arabis alpina]|uniref:Uncharacterized protein n=1 Tax=Arabis alpina TaxID=50452 RepID=A0A087GF82_ARAAL|nr:hypothetical protein AALP_AA7G009100 [Arabis alpina]
MSSGIVSRGRRGFISCKRLTPFRRSRLLRRREKIVGMEVRNGKTIVGTHQARFWKVEKEISPVVGREHNADEEGAVLLPEPHGGDDLKDGVAACLGYSV